MSNPANLTIQPKPETPEITQIGVYTLQAKQKLESNLSYEWKQDGIISSNNTNLLKVTTPSFLTVTAFKNFTLANQTISCRSNLSGAFSYIPENDLANIILYPNPSSDGLIMLEAKANMPDFTLTIYNELGQILYATPVSDLSTRRAVDLSFLSAGRYIVKMASADIVETKHFHIVKP